MFLLVAGALPAAEAGPAARPEVPHEVFAAVLEEAFPFPEDGPCDEDAPRRVVAVRSLPAWERPESLWILTVPWDGEPSLEVRRLKKRSLSDQLRKLEPAERAVAVQRDLLRLHTTSTGSGACRQLEELRRDFESLSVPALPENFLSLDDDRFHFWVDTCWGEPMEYKVTRVEGAYWGDLGPGTHPLLAWFDRLVAIEARCPRAKRP